MEPFIHLLIQSISTCPHSVLGSQPDRLGKTGFITKLHRSCIPGPHHECITESEAWKGALVPNAEVSEQPWPLPSAIFCFQF